MRRIILLTLCAFLCFGFSGDKTGSHPYSSNVNYLNNRAPLVSKPYIKLPLGAIKPQGWLLDQLQRQAEGLTGHLDKEYELVMGSRNGWLGGDGDQWERGPYWIDGLLPLAYLLDDNELKAKAEPWIEWTLQSQKPNGYFGPDTDYPGEPGVQRNNSHDWWPKMVMMKVLQQHYSATGDERVITLLTNYFKYQLEELPKTPLGNWTFWAEQRGGDNLMVIYWLYNITGDEFLLELGELVHKQTFNWTKIFSERNTITDPYRQLIHCVNLGQGIKEPIIYYQCSHDPAHVHAVKLGFSDIKKTLGYPTGMFGGDEWLHGNKPTQGVELCTIVELMLSLEEMTEITGDVYFADYLEKVAFNALPTQATDQYDSRQYYQQVNQVEISNRRRNFAESHEGTDNVFGILTGYPCCTSNMHQGWPKFTQNLWYATEDNGLAAFVYSPSEVTAKVAGGTEVKITENTTYPFEEAIRFTVTIPDKKTKDVMFPFHLRIPEWCREATITVNGEVWAKSAGNNVVKINRAWKSGDQVVLELPMHIRSERWYEKSASVEHGPLVYALMIGEDWKKVENTGPAGFGPWYYEVTATTPWNYALIESNLNNRNLQNAFSVERSQLPEGVYPWNLENAPVKMKTTGKRMDLWQMYNGQAGPMPYSPNVSTNPAEEITLVPYGCTTLRIGQFPVVR